METNDEVNLTELNMKPGEINARFEGSPLHLFAEMMVDFFKESGGKNYVEMNLNHETEGPFVVTMQRQLGVTPTQKLAKAHDLLRELVEQSEDDPEVIETMGSDFVEKARALLN